jgi:hypothetical protein
MASGAAKRDLRKESKWRRHVMAQAASGQSVRAYCRGRGISEQGFHWWRRELARRDTVKPAGAAAFVPVEVTGTPVAASASAGAVEIVLPGDRRVRVMGPVDRQQLADVLVVLEGSAGSAVRQGNGSC